MEDRPHLTAAVRPRNERHKLRKKGTKEEMKMHAIRVHFLMC